MQMCVGLERADEAFVAIIETLRDWCASDRQLTNTSVAIRSASGGTVLAQVSSRPAVAQSTRIAAAVAARRVVVVPIG
jgi:hypothetical protein